jgi:hypothetical protein
MVLSSVGALLLSGHLNPIMVWSLLAAIGGAWFVPAQWMRSRRWQTGWTVATIGAFLLCIAQIAVTGELVMAAIYFLLFLVANKLYNRQKARDHLQLYATSLMAVVAGAAVNTGPSYVACFAIHVLAAVWSLILFQLRREMEENYLLRHSDDASSERVEVARVLRSRRIVGWPFLSATALGATVVLGFSALVFLFFPRVGLASWGWGAPKGPMVGFSDRVNLGEEGFLRDNPEVVLRATFRDRVPKPVLRSLRWKATTFDQYRQGSWSRARALPWPQIHRFGWLTVRGERPETARQKVARDRAIDRAVRADILLMPRLGTILPAPHPVAAFALRRKAFTASRTLSLAHGGTVQNPRPGRMVAYTTLSLLTPPRAASSGGWPPPKALTARERRAYTQLPENLPRTFHRLARSLASSGDDPSERARAAMRHLSTGNGFSYSRRLPDIPTGHDPVVYFLLEAKRGHCEYFASSLALLLRAMDIPARMVTGFYGGRWNPYGGYLTVRQSDAHAWVEAFIPGRGWVVYDPTPAEGRAPIAEKGLWSRLGLWLDNLRLSYLRWVLDYDAQNQWSLVSGMKRWAHENRPPKGLLWGALFVLTAGLGLLGGAWLIKRLRPSGRSTSRLRASRSVHPATRTYRRLLSSLARAGYSRHKWQTPKELASHLRSTSPETHALVGKATELYYEARYCSPTEGEAAQKALARLEESTKKATEALTHQANR